MKLAIAYEGGQIPATFDHPQQLNIYDIQDAAAGPTTVDQWFVQLQATYKAPSGLTIPHGQ